MKIVHVAQTIAGGIASYLDETARHQAESFGLGNVHYVVPLGSDEHLPSVSPQQLTMFAGVKRTLGDLTGFGLAALRAIKKFDPDIVHIHSTFAGAIVRPLISVQRRRPQVVYCPHGWAFARDTSNLKKFVFAEVERVLARTMTDMIINVSDSERRLALHHGLLASKMRTIRSGVGQANVASCENARLVNSKIQLAFIGRHDHQKGLDILLEAIDAVNEQRFHLHIVGAGVLTRQECLPETVANDVTVHGWLSRLEIEALLQRVDAVIMPSRWEAFGLVAVEAMRSGVPVIASDRGALPEVLRDGVDGYLFDIDEPGSLARLLNCLDRRQLAVMGGRARVHFEREFTSDRMNREIGEAYMTVLKLGTRRSPIVLQVPQTEAVPGSAL